MYYVGLLAGRNDMALLARTGVGRDINRRYYNEHEIAEEVQRPVVQRLLQLIALRNTHPAFQGEFKLLSHTAQSIALQWQRGEDVAQLDVNFKSASGRLRYSQAQQMQIFDFLQADAPEALTI